MKKIIAILFVTFITLAGILTISLKPVQILGGLARGYISAPEGSVFLQKVGNAFKVFDSRTSEYFVFHDSAIHAYGAMQKALGRALIDDVDPAYEVLKLNNGYLTFKRTGTTDLTGLGEYLKNLKETSDKSGSELLYVKGASKETSSKELLPYAYPYESSSNYDSVEKALRASGISVLDVNAAIEKEKLDKYSLFFKTDHHYTPQTGVWVSKVISKSINDNFGFKLDEDLLDISNFDIKTYNNSFLGSQGKRVGALYGGVDDFDVITPKFETKMSMLIESESYEAKGEFSETLLRQEYIISDNLLNKNSTLYDTYMGGNHDLVQIENQSIPEGKTALLIMDSYGCVVAPYLSLVFEELDCIDIRSYTESVAEYIEETRPDIVIYMINTHQ